jgi:hypothetical protein
MRTTKRFSPAVLERFRRTGRGTRLFEHYTAWHQVTRGDPASLGRSHIYTFRGRQYDLLSDGEAVALFFAVQYVGPNDDLREQYPLALTRSPHDIHAYDVNNELAWQPGTIEIAEELGILHPSVNGEGRSEPWVFSTDLLLMQVNADGVPGLCAISVKPDLPQSRRATELLKIEREYWIRRAVPWLLITPDLYERLVGETLRRTWPWALASPSAPNEIDAAVRAIHLGCGRRSQTRVLLNLADELASMDGAQRALWQAVWFGHAPVDLRRGWRPHSPLRLIGPTEFAAQNPILMRRSAWTY